MVYKIKEGMLTMLHQIASTNKEIQTFKEPNKNSGLKKYNWNENYTRKTHQQIIHGRGKKIDR